MVLYMQENDKLVHAGCSQACVLQHETSNRYNAGCIDSACRKLSYRLNMILGSTLHKIRGL